MRGAGGFELPPLTALRQFDTCRLIPSRFAQQEDSVLQALAADASHLQDLFDLDNATNQRLVGERGGLPGIGIDELVFGTPNFRIVNRSEEHTSELQSPTTLFPYTTLFRSPGQRHQPAPRRRAWRAAWHWH